MREPDPLGWSNWSMSAWFETARRHRFAVMGAVVCLLLAASMGRGLLTPRRDLWVEEIHRNGYPASAAELDAWYLAVPAAQNAALVYTNAFAWLTNADGPITNFTSKNWLPSIGQGLSAEDRSTLKALLAEHQAAWRLFYTTPASDRCRYPVHLGDGPMTLLPHLAPLKRAVSLLSAEGLMHATEGDAEQATQSFLAAARVADSLSEEPIIISQLVRYAGWALLLPRLERALELAPFSDGQLAALQQVVGAAERPRAAARAWAGELAIHMSVFNERKFTKMGLFELQGARGKAGEYMASASLSLLRFSGVLERDKAFCCVNMGRELAALELPYPARFEACQQLAAITNVPNRMFIFSRMLLPALGRFHVREAGHVALVRTASAALAVERFRRAHTNALPASLQQLAPACCKDVPADPFDGKPLRYKTRGASFAVYSVGADGQDDGGVAWDSNYVKVPQDVAFLVKH
jgi:hypothetical protein